MEFQVIPNEQTPELALIQDEFIHDYIDTHRESLEAFLEYTKTRDDAVGLACNQVAMDGVRLALRAFAIRNMITRKWKLVIDPTVIGHGLKDWKAEGCLTWKGQTIVAERYRTVEVTYYDLDGELHTEVHKGFEGQIWQHEANHLNGVEEDVRDMFREPPPVEVGRNEPCPCGSGKKYKKCCLLF